MCRHLTKKVEHIPSNSVLLAPLSVQLLRVKLSKECASGINKISRRSEVKATSKVKEKGEVRKISKVRESTR